MTKEKPKNSLLSPEATGGDVAESGFQYQANLMASRVPHWLKQDGFTSAIREAMGDVEASFFIPELDISREFLEYKNHRLTGSEFWPEIEHFLEIDTQSPGTFHKFVLVCKGLSKDLQSILNALTRIRKAAPFYENARNINHESFSEFRKMVSDTYNRHEVAQFIFEKVYFEVDLSDSEGLAIEKFRQALYSCFPEFQEYPGASSTKAYTNVTELIKRKKNQPISRSEFEEAIFSSIQHSYNPFKSIHFHTANGENKEHLSSINFNWSRFWGGTGRVYPLAEEWNHILVGQLLKTKEWIVFNERPRNIILSGSRRLSASLALGAVFSAVAGFSIEMQTNNGIWRTNNYPSLETPDYTWNEVLIENQDNHELFVSLSTLNDIRKDVEQYINSTNFTGPHLSFFGANPIVSDQQTNIAVGKVKRSILREIAVRKVSKLHLFVAVPAQIALFLGHRLNSTCNFQCYERTSNYSYVETCQINI